MLSFHDSLLHQSDVDLLDNCQWLNDQIIEFYFEYQTRVLCKDNQSDVIFIGPGVTQLIKLVQVEEVLSVLPVLNADFKYAFFPVNDSMKTDRPGGTHWSLLLYRKEDRYFLHYESMPGLTNYFHARAIADKVNSALNPSADLNFKQEFCCKQENSYDCGVHVICNVDYLVRKFVFGANEDWFDARDVERRRKELKELILSLKN